VVISHLLNAPVEESYVSAAFFVEASSLEIDDLELELLDALLNSCLLLVHCNTCFALIL
jgi:hypothetical protein